MRRIFCCMLLLIIICFGENVFAASDFLICENFESFEANKNGTAYPNGMYAQNFEGINDGAGIYSVNDIYGKSAVIKTTLNRGNTQLAYRYTQPTTGTVCFEVDLKIMDKNLNRLIQTRYGTGADTIINVITISKTGLVYLGNKVIEGLNWQCSKWYHVKLIINQAEGIAMAEIESQDGEKHESVSDIEKNTYLYSLWITNGGINNAITYVDNWSIKSCNDNPKMKYYRLNSFETINEVQTNGELTKIKGNNSLLLHKDEYVSIDKNIDESVFTYAVDVFFYLPAEANIIVDNEIVLKITKNAELFVNTKKIGTISPLKWYKIYVTIDITNNLRYVTVSTDTKLVGSYKDKSAAYGKFKICNLSGNLYLDNMGIVESGFNIEPVYINFGAQFAEFVYPCFIDKETVQVYVNGNLCDAVLPGTRTIRVENIQENSKIYIKNTRDLCGHYLDIGVDFIHRDMFSVEFSQNILQSGNLGMTVGTE